MATPDIALLPLIQKYGAIPYLGSEENVLGRYVNCAKANGLESVVRLTGDCPFVDPNVVSDIVEMFEGIDADYVSNVLTRSYPYGLDVEVITVEALKRTQKLTNELTVLAGSDRIGSAPGLRREYASCGTTATPQTLLLFATKKKYREHVTLYVREHLELFNTLNVTCNEDWTAYDWRLDKPEDLPDLRFLYSYCRGSSLCPFRNMATMYSYGQQYLRVPAGIGSGTGRDSAAHGVNADPADATSHSKGLNWYERGYSDTTSG